MGGMAVPGIPQISPLKLHDREFLDFPWPTQVEEETKEKSELMVTATRAHSEWLHCLRGSRAVKDLGVIEDGAQNLE